MTKISNDAVYIIDTDISDLDYIIGTDGNTLTKKTKNFLLGPLRSYFKSGLSPLTGGVLRFTEITYTGGLYPTVADLVNALDPFFTIDQYHVVVVALNGAKSILKLQDRQVGLDKTPVIAGDFIAMTSTIDAVLATGNTTNEAINFIDGVTSANINAYQAQFTDSSNNSYRMQSNGFIAYNTAQNNTWLKLPIKPLQNVIFQTPLKDAGTYTFALSTDIPTVESSTLDVTQVGNVITIETPTVSDIPALIVNSAYTGIEELGTSAKPFKTIQAALDAYKGTGGKGTILDPTSPELLGSTIEIYRGSEIYNFVGDFNYKDVKISFKEDTIVSSNPTVSWLSDFNSFSTTTTHNPTLTFDNGAFLYCAKSGFKIVGGDFALNTYNRKALSVYGSRTNSGIVLIGTNESDILFEVDGSNLQYVNGGYQHLFINTFISTNRGRLFVIKGNGNVICDNMLTYILNDPFTATITNTYPIVELRNIARLVYTNSNIQANETPTVIYDEFVSTYDSALFEARDCAFSGHTEYFAFNNSVENTATIRLDSCKMYINTSTSFSGTISGLWQNMALTNNNMPVTSINYATTAIQPYCINTIGGKVIETLGTYSSKEAASTAGLIKGSKFINQTDITAGVFVIGVEYKILTLGTTNFTLIGASANTVGLYFTASGVGIGTGTASLIKVDIVI